MYSLCESIVLLFIYTQKVTTSVEGSTEGHLDGGRQEERTNGKEVVGLPSVYTTQRDLRVHRPRLPPETGCRSFLDPGSRAVGRS